jgi:hypothetical protein
MLCEERLGQTVAHLLEYAAIAPKFHEFRKKSHWYPLSNTPADWLNAD